MRLIAVLFVAAAIGAAGACIPGGLLAPDDTDGSSPGDGSNLDDGGGTDGGSEAGSAIQIFSGGVVDIAIDSAHIYFTEDSPWDVRVCPLTGCISPVLLANAPGGQPERVVVNQSYVYWTDYDGVVWSCATTGCSNSPTMIATSGDAGPYGPQGIAVDDTNVYWTLGKHVLSCPHDGDGGLGTVWVGSGSNPLQLAVDSTNLYWTESVPAATVSQCAKADCDATVMALATSPNNPQPIAVDSTNVYWGDNGARMILKCPIDGGTTTTIADDAGSPTRIVTDSTGLYWADGNNPGGITRCDVGGGSCTQIAIAHGAKALVTDATYVYWADSNGIWKVQK